MLRYAAPTAGLGARRAAPLVEPGAIFRHLRRAVPTGHTACTSTPLRSRTARAPRESFPDRGRKPLDALGHDRRGGGILTNIAPLKGADMSKDEYSDSTRPSSRSSEPRDQDVLAMRGRNGSPDSFVSRTGFSPVPT
jgi:hypothetical protein